MRNSANDGFTANRGQPRGMLNYTGGAIDAAGDYYHVLGGPTLSTYRRVLGGHKDVKRDRPARAADAPPRGYAPHTEHSLRLVFGGSYLASALVALGDPLGISAAQLRIHLPPCRPRRGGGGA